MTAKVGDSVTIKFDGTVTAVDPLTITVNDRDGYSHRFVRQNVDRLVVNTPPAQVGDVIKDLAGVANLTNGTALQLGHLVAVKRAGSWIVTGSTGIYYDDDIVIRLPGVVIAVR